MPAITLLPELLALPRRIELRSLAFQTSVITRPTQAATALVETEGVEPPTSECKTDVLPLAPRPRMVGAG